MTSAKETAEKLGRFWDWKNGETEMVTTALEQAYARGIEASAECAKWQAVKAHVIGYDQACMDCAIAIKALAHDTQRDV